SLLEKENWLTPDGRRKLEIIQRAIDDAAHTIGRMKDFYRQREAQLTLVPVAIEKLLPQVLDLTQARWRDMAQERGVTINIRSELAPDAPSILGVESELREALVNLVFNAVDALPEGGTIVLRSKRLAGPAGCARVQIDTIDDGVGMDAATQERCLEPFFTTKGERGSGLGLAMVYGIVQRHSGDFEIRSAPGEGTLVRLTFDAAPPAGAAVEANGALSRPPTRLRVLVVDDDPILLRSLRDVLEGDGHVVLVANEGKTAADAFVEALQSGKPFDAVI